ncbi:helix-turn-helix domain-containing protein [Nocardia sp. CDC186]|uniref:Helix-turn-helix domain-containing protein n=1 Tax=Nocardia implantans TaxID=3108168 RepID=A0ABU6AMX7_9NOCA|nr:MULTISPECIES: helix-turn-helix domain-containing protein [unclassified Nocardia]MBF6193606.1 helix-turn-helix domain-containing protein [Nocardia beijingensis]MEA3532215.1 helix-turn-helix domain-containing protein [Nocardia sp. CDC192]MEB3508706.1 helix-turn-helix domain-containing protein [Nocardia sp. CDC186]
MPSLRMEVSPVADGEDEVVRAVVSTMLRGRDQLIAELSAVMRAQVVALDSDVRLRGLFEAGTTDNLMSVLDFVQNDAAEHDVHAPARALMYARTLAQRDVPLSALIRAYRVGHAGFLDIAMRYAVELGGSDSAAAIIRMVHRSAVYIDRVCEQVGIAYEQERDRWVGSRGGLRQEWVARVLDGSADDIAQAEQVLGYPLSGRHVAVNAWTEPQLSARAAVDVLDAVRAALVPLLGHPRRALLVPTDEREVRLWFSIARDTTIDAEAIQRALSALALPVRVAVGGCGSGVAGFRRSLRQADRVRELVLLAGPGAPRAVSHQQVAAVALLGADIEELRQYVADCLGELATDNQRNLWLRETLRVFLANNRSYAAAAEELAVHRNTVQYRVRQALDLTGHTFDDHDRTLHLHLALQAARWFGPAVLRPCPA